MGSRMARRLLAAGHPLVGYNRTVAKAAPLVAAGMKLAASPRHVAEAAQVIFSIGRDTEGLAATMKIATNLGIAVQMLAFSEAVLLAEKAGIARERAVETLLKSVVASPMLKYRGPFVLEMPGEALFNVPMMQKDLALALELGHQTGVPLPTTALTQSMLTAAQALGLGEHDFAVVFDVLARLSGLPGSPRPR